VDGKNDPEGTVSVNLSSKKILLYRLSSPEALVKLEFSKRYGDVVRYHWFGDGYLLIGFHRGRVVVVSTHIKECGDELQSLEVFQNELYDIAFGKGAQKFAAIGDDGLHIVDMTDWKEIKSQYTRFSESDGEPVSLSWSDDGQILTCSTSRGKVINYLMSIPSVSGGYGNESHAKIAYLSSLKHVCVKNMTDRGVPDAVMEIAIEPSFIAMGKNHVAVGMNNSVWYYNPSVSMDFVSSRDYTGMCICMHIYMPYV
jgi:WD repeat-containing protein 19